MQVKTHIRTDIGVDRHIDRGVDRHIGRGVDRHIDRGDRQTKYAGTHTQTEGQRDRRRDSGVVFKMKFSIKLISETIFQ